MIRIAAALTALTLVTGSASAAGVTGQYIEARTCDVWTGPCFANAEVNLGGKHAVMGWKIDKGTFDNVSLDGLSVVAVVAASDTLGIVQTGPARSVMIVDKQATPTQRDALIRLAKSQAGQLLANVIQVESADINLERCPCKTDVCAVLKAGSARIETRCLGHEDRICGNESAFYPPLVKNVKATAAMASEHTFQGAAFRETWKEHGRRSAYVGSFEIR